MYESENYITLLLGFTISEYFPSPEETKSAIRCCFHFRPVQINQTINRASGNVLMVARARVPFYSINHHNSITGISFVYRILTLPVPSSGNKMIAPAATVKYSPPSNGSLFLHRSTQRQNSSSNRTQKIVKPPNPHHTLRIISWVHCSSGACVCVYVTRESNSRKSNPFSDVALFTFFFCFTPSSVFNTDLFAIRSFIGVGRVK